jgi:hypothetical protein
MAYFIQFTFKFAFLLYTSPKTYKLAKKAFSSVHSTLHLLQKRKDVFRLCIFSVTSVMLLALIVKR